MTDWVGLIFFGLVVAGIIIGLKLLARPAKRTEAEFERNAAEGTTALGASMNALQELMDPAAAKSKETITQMKEGRYQKKKREGKANANETGDASEAGHN